MCCTPGVVTTNICDGLNNTEQVRSVSVSPRDSVKASLKDLGYEKVTNGAHHLFAEFYKFCYKYFPWVSDLGNVILY